MAQKGKKTSILSRLRNNFFAGAVVLIPIGITLYLSLFIIKVSSNILPKELNPNNYLPFEIPGIEIIIAVIIITFIGWLSLSFLGKKIFELINRILKRIPILRTILSNLGIILRRYKNCRPITSYEKDLIKNGIVIKPNFLQDEEFQKLKK